MAFSLWIGLGVASILEFVESQAWRPGMIPVTASLILLVFGINAFGNYPDVDASQDTRAVDFAAHVLENAPKDAILFVHAGEDIFTLRYYVYALGQRPDLALLSGALVDDWYREIMRQTYPTLQIPEKDCYNCLARDIIALNPRPACDVFYDAKEILVCLP